MSAGDRVRKGLEEFLSQLWDEPVSIENLQPASAGARRQNLFFDAKRGTESGESLSLVATITPNQAMQVMDVEVEADTLRLAEAAGTPVAHVVASTSDTSFVGGPFFITTRVAGETIPRRVLRLIESHPGLGAELAQQCGQALARLHAIDPSKGRAELARPGPVSPAEHAIAVTEALMDALLQPSPAYALGLRWLVRQLPDPPDRTAILHGDFRNGNIIVDEQGLRAALDWEVAKIGDPMEDLAWLCMRMWRFRNDALEVGGFGSASDLRAGYEAMGGQWRQESFHWWKVLCTLRWGLGLAGQAAAHLSGSVPSIVMAASGRRVAELEYDVLMLIRGSYTSD
jgi:aminoglycoside phosphotransferase (APT) family kinase protein